MAKKIKWTLLSIALLLVAGIGYYTYAFIHFSNNIQRKPESSKLFSTLTPNNTNGQSFIPPKWEGYQRVNILLLGGDSRGLKKNEIPRSDSLIIASIDPVTKKAYLFSILRDTYVKIPGYGEDRINSALAIGGPNLAMKTVGDLLGIPVQYYVYTDFKGFIALVDAIDGIDIDVEKDMKYSDSEDGHEYDINLKKGLQHLDGKSALQYVRFRHDAMSDFARTERQRKFLQAVTQKMQTTYSLIRLPRILSSVDPYIETNLTTSDMLKLGTLGYEAKTEGMISQQIPPSELLIEQKVGGADVLTVNRDRLQEYIKALFAGRDPGAAIKQTPVKDTTKGTVPLTNPSSGIKSGITDPQTGGGSKSGGVNTTSSGTVSKSGTQNAVSPGEAKTSAANPALGAAGKSSGSITSTPVDSKNAPDNSISGKGRKNGATGAAATDDAKNTNAGPVPGSVPAKNGGAAGAAMHDSKTNGAPPATGADVNNDGTVERAVPSNPRNGGTHPVPGPPINNSGVRTIPNGERNGGATAAPGQL